jgi:hypothetical protein
MKRTWGFLLVSALIVVAGCYLPLKEPEGYSTEFQDEFQDIPIPFKGGYEYLESSSFTYVAPASDAGELFRVGKLRIVGDTRVDEIVKFYKRQMILHDFELKNEFESKEVHKITLSFTKKDRNELCTVEIERRGTHVHIQMTIGPA